MKYFSKILFSIAVTAAFFTACKKEAMTVYTHGSATVLSASTTTVAPVTADSNKNVISFLWTSPKYATDSATIKYLIQIDSSGRNFSKANSKTVIGLRTATYTAKELNSIVLAMGFKFNVAYDVDVRLVSSYGNNNDQFQSNIVKIKVTPYVTPPKVMPPASKMLFIVGNATAGGWGNPVPAPAQQFTLIDSVTYQGTFFLNGGKSYLLLPDNGKWDNKYNIADASAPKISEGGVFGANMGSANIPAPAATGMYTIKVDFQNGTFAVTKVNLFGLLYVPGNYQGWTPASASTLGSPANDGNYDGYINIPAGGTYEFKFTPGPDWSNGLGDGGNGTLSPGGGNLKVSAGGYYHIFGNTVKNTWSATATTWGVIGSFAASNWGSDVPMVYDAGNNKWTATITTKAGDQFKFRGNSDWGLNYGDNDDKGSLVGNGNNIGDVTHTPALTAGTHTITLFLGNPGYYTYMIQ